MDTQLSDLVIQCVQELTTVEGRKGNGPVDANTILFGADGILDSMGLVNLVILVEQSIVERYNAAVTLADRRALSRSNSPFRTVQSLAEYAHDLLVGAA